MNDLVLYGRNRLTHDASTVGVDLRDVAPQEDVEAACAVLTKAGVDPTLATYVARYTCALLTLSERYEDANKDAATALAERMPGYVLRARVDHLIASGWACIAVAATANSVRWRAICYALSDTFGIKQSILDRATLVAIKRAREVV